MEGFQGSLWAPGSVAPRLHGAPVPAGRTLRCGAGGGWGLSSSCRRQLCLEPLLSNPDLPFPLPHTTSLEGFCRLMDRHLEGGGRPQIPVFLKKEGLMSPLELSLGCSSSRCLPWPGRQTAQREAGGSKALVMPPCV